MVVSWQEAARVICCSRSLCWTCASTAPGACSHLRCLLLPRALKANPGIGTAFAMGFAWATCCTALIECTMVQDTAFPSKQMAPSSSWRPLPPKRSSGTAEPARGSAATPAWYFARMAAFASRARRARIGGARLRTTLLTLPHSYPSSTHGRRSCGERRAVLWARLHAPASRRSRSDGSQAYHHRLRIWSLGCACQPRGASRLVESRCATASSSTRLSTQNHTW